MDKEDLKIGMLLRLKDYKCSSEWIGRTVNVTEIHDSYFRWKATEGTNSETSEYDVYPVHLSYEIVNPYSGIIKELTKNGR